MRFQLKNILKAPSKKNNTPKLGVLKKETPFAIREAYRALYTNILYLNIEDKCKKIAVTSAISGEGKTTVSTNLALTLAQNLEDKRVLLVDTDMRRPKVAKLLSIDRREHGLSEYLAGIDDEPNFIHLEKEHLTVITSGATNVSPTKLIGSNRMQKFLADCEENYDYIIIDTPPVNVVTDAVLLNGHINGYIISTNANYSNINALAECVETLERLGAEIFGIVLSSLKLKVGSRKYSKYSKYSKYGNEAVD